MTIDAQGTTGERLLDLLEAFAARPQGASLAEAATATGMPLSTAYRFAKLLIARGYAVRAPGGMMLPGPALASLAQAASPHAALAALARPALRRLARTSAATVHLGIFENDMVTYIVKEAGDGELFTREGMQLEAYCSAIGKLLLADLPAAELDRYLGNGPFVPLTSRTLTDPAALRTHLKQVREQGYAVDDREVSDRLICVAVPVRDGSGRTVAALSRSSTEGAPSFGRLLGSLRRCASTIEQGVGKLPLFLPS